MLKTSFFCFFFTLGISCNFSNRNPGVQEALTGNWILLYPDHQRNTSVRAQLYSKAQDSIVNLMGLKLLMFKEKGNFQLMDSLFRNSGKWMVKQNELQVNGAGNGWNKFNGRLIGFRNDTLQLVEYIPLSGDSVRIVWFLKKINSADKGAALFEEENNTWRRKSSTPETRVMLQKKIKKILEYYSLYFEVVAEESMYFVGGRVPLPLRYYQHGAGLNPFNRNDAFSKLFYNAVDAGKAHDILEDIYLKDRKKEFPKADNFVAEYAKFLHRMAGRLD